MSVNGHEVDFYNVHLQAEWFGAKQIRLQQLAELKNFIVGSIDVEKSTLVATRLSEQHKVSDHKALIASMNLIFE